MGWAVGTDRDRRRHIGYGVPATCDQPGCEASIDRGLAYACGGGIAGTVDNCGLFFCSEHLVRFQEDDADGGEWICERCADEGAAPFDPSPDTEEWARHVLTDESWERFRTEEPAWTEHYRSLITTTRKG